MATNYATFWNKKLWCGTQQTFQRSLCGNCAETVRKLCLSTKFSHQEFRWNNGILCSGCFNVAVRLIWRRDVRQRQINVETTLCTSTLEFTTLNNVVSILSILTLIWTTLDNVKTTMSFLTSISATLGNVETTLSIWPFLKN